MLTAQKNQQLTGLQVRALAIREKELQYWTRNYGTIASQSAFILGFTFSGMHHAEGGEKTFIQQMLQMFYLATTTACVGCGLYTVLVASMSSILAPGMALRGPFGPQSMHIAVDALTAESVGCYNFFITQLCFFYMSCSLLMWANYQFVVAFPVNIIFLYFMVRFLLNAQHLVKVLKVQDGEAVSGQFENFGRRAQDMKDLQSMQFARDSQSTVSQQRSKQQLQTNAGEKLNVENRNAWASTVWQSQGNQRSAGEDLSKQRTGMTSPQSSMYQGEATFGQHVVRTNHSQANYQSEQRGQGLERFYRRRINQSPRLYRPVEDVISSLIDRFKGFQEALAPASQSERYQPQHDVETDLIQEHPAQIENKQPSQAKQATDVKQQELPKVMQSRLGNAAPRRSQEAPSKDSFQRLQEELELKQRQLNDLQNEARAKADAPPAVEKSPRRS